MKLFGKREAVFEKRDYSRWLKAKAVLAAAGIEIMEASFYEDEMPICGCGAKMDARDFGPDGKIDRRTYYISVKPEDAQRARTLLAEE